MTGIEVHINRKGKQMYSPGLKHKLVKLHIIYLFILKLQHDAASCKKTHICRFCCSTQKNLTTERIIIIRDFWMFQVNLESSMQ